MHSPSNDFFYVLSLGRDTVDFMRGDASGLALLERFHRSDWSGRHRDAIREVVLRSKVLPLKPFEMAARFVDHLQALLPEPPRADLRRTKGFFQQVHRALAPQLAKGTEPLFLAGTPGYIGLFKHANKQSSVFKDRLTAQLVDVEPDEMFLKALSIFRIHQRALQRQDFYATHAHSPLPVGGA